MNEVTCKQCGSAICTPFLYAGCCSAECKDKYLQRRIAEIVRNNIKPILKHWDQV